jgi:chromosome segregation ATPase
MKYVIGQHGASIAELASALEEINSLQAELTTVQNDAMGLQTKLKDVLGQHGTTVAELASAQEEIAHFQVDLQTVSEQNRSYTQDLENARQERSKLVDELHEEQQSDELLKELIATNESLEKASAVRAVAETELIILRERASKNSAAEAELEKVSVELNVLKEAKAKLAESIAQQQRLSLHFSNK